MSDGLARARWDEDYTRGRYQGAEAEPVPFVSEIIERARELGDDARGLYPGCGNGRNFLPLVDAGLNVTGLDVSGVAIDQLVALRPDIDPPPIRHDFLSYARIPRFDYLVSIQLFQHTDERNQRHIEMIDHARSLLRRGGLLFLRVNSINTQIAHKYSVQPESDDGGFSVRYLDGPKKGMYIHFYSADELEAQAEANDFEVEQAPREVTMKRPDNSTWAQWETVWRAA